MSEPGAGPGRAVRVLLFAGARDVVGRGELSLELPEGCATAAALLDHLAARYAGLAPYRASLRMAVNGEYARDADPVRPGDEVAVIPPVAGG